ncbi:hypothetical protein D3C81_1304010 [compost metagenome]
MIAPGQRNISSGIYLRRTLLGYIAGRQHNILTRSKRAAILHQRSLRSKLQVFITDQGAISQGDSTLTGDG